MAKFKKNNSKASQQPITRIPISSILSTGRQPASKRQPYEVENIDNAFVSLERNVEKRTGFRNTTQHSAPNLTDGRWDFSNNNTAIDLYALRSVRDHDLWYYWYNVNEENRFLVVVDFSATGGAQTLFYTFQLLTDGTWKDITTPTQWDPTNPLLASPFGTTESLPISTYAAAQTPPISYAAALALGTISDVSRKYITYKPPTQLNITAKESLRAVTLGSSVIVLNRNVCAGFSSDYKVGSSTNGMLFNLSGTVGTTPDLKGRRVTYYSASRVVEVFDDGEDDRLGTDDDISLGYKADQAASGLVRTNSSGIEVALQNPAIKHEGYTRIGSTANTILLSTSSSTVPNLYNGLIVSVTPNTVTTPSELSASIVDYNEVSHSAECWNKTPSRTGVLTGDTTGTLNYAYIETGLNWNAHLRNKYIVINNKYLYINSYDYVNGLITFTTTLGSSYGIHLIAGSPYTIVNFLESRAEMAGDRYSVIIDFGCPTGSGYTHTYKGKLITISGQTRVITAYDGATREATWEDPLASAPIVNTPLRINDGIGWSGYIYAQNIVNKTITLLPSQAVGNEKNFIGYHLKTYNGNPVVITNYNWDTATITYTGVITPAPAVGNLFQIIPPPSSYYKITENNAEEDYYNGLTITLQNAGTSAITTRLISSYSNITNTVTVDSAVVVYAGTTNYRISNTLAAFIPARDYVYYKTELYYLGQSVLNSSQIRLPPQEYDWYGNNSKLSASGTVDDKAKVMLKALYDEFHPHKTYVDGRGKIYYTAGSYLSSSAGYYRVIDFVEDTTHTIISGTGQGIVRTGSGNPYLQKIRTQDEHSYIDPARMPQKFSFTLNTNLTYNWSAEPLRWTPRDSGDNTSNPGPSVFKTSNGIDLRHVPINSLAVFKNRLWFSAGDIVFSSRLGDYENLFIDDPSNIVDTDPIDIRASTNSFAEIRSMTPFENYMFVNTKSDTQFQLQASTALTGQELSITPFNVSLSPSTYYAAAAVIDPQLLGNQLYFFDKRRMYLFTGKNQLGFTSAVEVSATVKDYLPENFDSVCVSSAYNTVYMTDKDNQNTIYCYTIRFSGERLIQSSFYRFILSPFLNVRTLQAYNNKLYAVVVEGTVAEDTSKFYLQELDLQDTSITIPRIDNMYLTKMSVGIEGYGSYANTSYDYLLNETTIKIPKVGIFTKFIVNGFSTDLFLVLGENWVMPTSYSITASLGAGLLFVTNTSEQNVITVGSVITGAGLPAGGILITGIADGVGGVGTYTTNSALTIASQTFVTTSQDDISGTIFSDFPFKATVESDHIKFVLLGKYDKDGGEIYIGIAYKTTIELSEVFVRDLDSKVYNGTLNLRSCKIKHANTGNYDIEVSHRGRTAIISSFSALKPDFTTGENVLSLSTIEDSGKFLTKIFGYSESVNVKLTSDYITPMNIIDVEFIGKFKARHTII